MYQIKSLYSNSENNSKNTNSVTYTGINTDSVLMNVDNDKNTISAEVVWKDLLGLTADKAYPGNLGEENRRRILELLETINSEISRSTSLDAELNNRINNVNNNLVKATEELTQIINSSINTLNIVDIELSNKILNEVSRAKAAEDSLIKLIEKEALERNTQSKNSNQLLLKLTNDLNKKQNELETRIENEENRAKDKELYLEKLFDLEIRRAIEAEEELHNLLISTEYELKDLITEVDRKLFVETETREVADIALENKLNSEVDRAIAEEKLILNNLENYKVANDQKITNLSNTTVNINNKLINEIKVREKETSDLNSKLISEIDRSTKSDSDINKEITALKSADQKMSSQIEDVVTYINTELTDTVEELTSVDQQIRYSILKEVSDRESDVTALRESINSEVSRATSAENSLIKRVDDIEEELSGTFVQQITVDGADDSSYVYAANKNGDNSILVTDSVEENAVVMRDDTGNVNVPVGVEYTDTSAIPKYLLDTELRKLKSEIKDEMESFNIIKFIDGGTAPI